VSSFAALSIFSKESTTVFWAGRARCPMQIMIPAMKYFSDVVNSQEFTYYSKVAKIFQNTDDTELD
jgi:hypothetical protein